MMQHPKPLHVLGVNHNINHPEASHVFTYLTQHIVPGTRVAIESPVQLETILTEFENSKNASYQFLYNLSTHLLAQEATVIPVEDMRMLKLQSRRQWRFMYEESERLANDWIWQKLTILRSVRHLELAHEAHATYLVTGGYHAYDLQHLGYPKVTFLSEFPLECRHEEDRALAKYASPFLRERVARCATSLS